MSNDLIPVTSQVAVSKQDARFLEIRMDSHKYKRIYKYEKTEAVFQMSKIVTKAFLYRGQAVDSASVNFISNALVEEILLEEKWGAKYLTFEEIEMIVKGAVLGNAEMFGVSVASLYKVILDWVKTDGTRLQNQAAELKRQQNTQALRDSMVAPMLQAYADSFSKNHKI
jgi:hypothetical protein